MNNLKIKKMRQIVPRIQKIKITGENSFSARVNYRNYIGTFFMIGNLKAIDYMREINSEKQTTWKIITFTESELNKL